MIRRRVAPWRRNSPVTLRLAELHDAIAEVTVVDKRARQALRHAARWLRFAARAESDAADR